MVMAIGQCWSMSALSNIVGTSFMWLLSIYNVAAITEALSFIFIYFFKMFIYLFLRERDHVCNLGGGGGGGRADTDGVREGERENPKQVPYCQCGA